MTSLFSVIAHEDSNDQGKLRQAMALAHQRVEDRFGAFVRQGSVDDQAARFTLVAGDVTDAVVAACEQVGYGDPRSIFETIAKNFVTADAQPQLRTAGVRHEARKPKMCPYHSEVTDISLAQGEPQAGFNAMAQHAWGAKHCQGEGYEGDRCKFKPEMTTQSYWDSRAEKLEQKRQERAERADQLQQEQQVTELPEVETPEEPVAEVEEIHEHSEPSAIGEGVDEAPVEAVPMAMAAHVANIGPGQYEVTLQGQGGYTQTFPVQAADENEARQKAIRQNVAQGGQTAWAQHVASTKTADGGPIPKMDKGKWKPKTEAPDTEDDNSRWPTKRKDVTEPIKQEQGSRENPSKLNEIGEQVAERQDVTQKGGPAKTEQGGTFGGGERSAVSSLLDPIRIQEALSKFKRD